MSGSGALWKACHERVAALGSRTALSMPAGELGFAELFGRGDEIASALARAGVREGGVVGLALPNSLPFVPALLALFRLSATVALVSPGYREAELRSIDAGLRPGAFLTEPRLAAALSQALGLRRAATIRVPGPARELELLLEPSRRAAATCPQEVAVVKFSSGSTGSIKGIGLGAANVLAEARNLTATLALTPRDRILAPVPLFHSYGFDLGVLPMLYAGARLELRSGFVPRRTLGELCDREVSLFLGVPSMYRIFVETLLSDTPDLSHLRYLLSCTAPLRPDLIAAFHQAFRVPICQHYGSSETGAVTNHRPDAVLERPDSVGRPVHGVELTIRDAAGRRLPAGSEGEVVVRSEVVAPGYVMGGPPGPSRFGADGYRTGDLGAIDADGFLRLSGRVDDVINVGGFKVSPSEVVRVLEGFACVREAAVIGIEDALGQEVVHAAVTLKAPATEQEILAFCRSRLSDYKIPRRVEIRDEMPRGPSGKIRLTREEVLQ